jgi:hypothetical protein
MPYPDLRAHEQFWGESLHPALYEEAGRFLRLHPAPQLGLHFRRGDLEELVLRQKQWRPLSGANGDFVQTAVAALADSPQSRVIIISDEGSSINWLRQMVEQAGGDVTRLHAGPSREQDRDGWVAASQGRELRETALRMAVVDFLVVAGCEYCCTTWESTATQFCNIMRGRHPELAANHPIGVTQLKLQTWQQKNQDDVKSLCRAEWPLLQAVAVLRQAVPAAAAPSRALATERLTAAFGELLRDTSACEEVMRVACDFVGPGYKSVRGSLVAEHIMKMDVEPLRRAQTQFNLLVTEGVRGPGFYSMLWHLLGDVMEAKGARYIVQRHNACWVHVPEAGEKPTAAASSAGAAGTRTEPGVSPRTPEEPPRKRARVAEEGQQGG